MGCLDPDMSTQTEKVAEAAGGRRSIVTQVSSLAELVGAHPEALRKIYGAAKAADPAELGAAPLRGRLLALEPTEPVFMLFRPVVELLAREWMPWKGKEFEPDGGSGTNIVLGRRALRFRAEIEPSEIDGAPTLALTYDDPATRNPWPIRAVRDELRTVASGVAIGPAFLEWRGRRIPLLWFGLEGRDGAPERAVAAAGDPERD
jgi:hypothetical protein